MGGPSPCARPQWSPRRLINVLMPRIRDSARPTPPFDGRELHDGRRRADLPEIATTGDQVHGWTHLRDQPQGRRGAALRELGCRSARVDRVVAARPARRRKGRCRFRAQDERPAPGAGIRVQALEPITENQVLGDGPQGLIERASARRSSRRKSTAATLRPSRAFCSRLCRSARRGAERGVPGVRKADGGNAGGRVQGTGTAADSSAGTSRTGN